MNISHSLPTKVQSDVTSPQRSLSIVVVVFVVVIAQSMTKKKSEDVVVVVMQQHQQQHPPFWSNLHYIHSDMISLTTSKFRRIVVDGHRPVSMSTHPYLCSIVLSRRCCVGSTVVVSVSVSVPICVWFYRYLLRSCSFPFLFWIPLSMKWARYVLRLYWKRLEVTWL